MAPVLASTCDFSSRVIRITTSHAALTGERFHSRRFVVFYVEDGVELGDLQQVVDLFGELQQFEVATFLAHGGVGADQLPDAGAIDVVDVTQVEKNLLAAFGKQAAHSVAQSHTAFAQSDAATQVHDSDAVDLARAGFHGHGCSSLLAADWPRRFTNVISVPGRRSRNRTSSINVRITKIPRPWSNSRFSGANGS